jgi:predicted nucleic acid-binding protein
VNRAFVDSGGFFAFLVSHDQFHRHAAELFRRARSERWQLVTTNAVAFETHALLVARVRNGRDVGVRFLDALDKGMCIVERVLPSDESAAAALIRAHQDKDYSMCDALSFVVMERLGVDQAIAFDRHFESTDGSKSCEIANTARRRIALATFGPVRSFGEAAGLQSGQAMRD